MYNEREIEHVGKHDYDKESAIKYASWGGKSFSVNIFKWGLKSNGKSMKPLKCVVRVSGKPSEIDKVFAFCDLVKNQLDQNEWDGRKTVNVNW